MVQWLEKEGYDVSYTDDVSLSQNPGQLLGHQIDLVSGHSEYWSLEQFNGFLAARNAGVNLAAFSSNTSLLEGPLRGQRAHARLLQDRPGHRLDRQPATTAPTTGGPTASRARRTTPWASTRSPARPTTIPRTRRRRSATTARANGDPNAPPGGRVGPDKPENQLWGNMYYGAELSAGAFPMQIPATNAQSQFSGDRIWRNTGISTSTTTTIGTNLTGWEWDAIPTQAQYLTRQPANVKPLNQQLHPARAERRLAAGRGPDLRQDAAAGPVRLRPGRQVHRRQRRARLRAGTNNWANALAPNPDSRIIQATYNIFSDMGVQPVTPVGVTLDPPSGPQPPTASFTVTPNPAQTGQTVTFNGSASSDPDGPITKYEWDLDGDGTYETRHRHHGHHHPHLLEHRRDHRAAARHRRAGRPQHDQPRALDRQQRERQLSVARPGHQRPRQLLAHGRSERHHAGRRHRQQQRDRRRRPDARRSGRALQRPRHLGRLRRDQRHRQREPQPHEHQRGDRRVLDAVEQLRQQRRPGDGVHPELQLDRGRLPDRSRTRASRAGSSPSPWATTRRATPPTSSVRRAGRVAPLRLRARHHGDRRDADHPVRRRQARDLHEDRVRHRRRHLRQLAALHDVARRDARCSATATSTRWPSTPGRSTRRRSPATSPATRRRRRPRSRARPIRRRPARW